MHASLGRKIWLSPGNAVLICNFHFHSLCQVKLKEYCAHEDASPGTTACYLCFSGNERLHYCMMTMGAQLARVSLGHARSSPIPPLPGTAHTTVFLVFIVRLLLSQRGSYVDVMAIPVGGSAVGSNGEPPFDAGKGVASEQSGTGTEPSASTMKAALGPASQTSEKLPVPAAAKPVIHLDVGEKEGNDALSSLEESSLVFTDGVHTAGSSRPSFRRKRIVKRVLGPLLVLAVLSALLRTLSRYSWTGGSPSRQSTGGATAGARGDQRER
ncbi:hypothetical protein TGARI_203740 [Toxoplasma gondii ARI]|uniref:Uncharacterized protein n=1 Tax=Toxoplasma gondii ARI TaxID=1074872 RepID=A0A139XZV7_TOXGO|nr:hypothetical protein TGARI_203740 [Toxoplasma gondii ARI]